MSDQSEIVIIYQRIKGAPMPEIAISNLMSAHFNLGLMSERMARASEKASKDLSLEVPEDQHSAIFSSVHLIQNIALEANLRATHAQAVRFSEWKRKFEPKNNSSRVWLLRNTHFKAFSYDLKTISQTLTDELQQTAFILVLPPMMGFFKPSEPLFGLGVEAKIATAKFDISEAAKCLALGLPTASVMHLMRVAEAGLKTLATELGVQKQNDWGSYLRKIETELASRARQPGTRQDERAHFAEIAAQLAHVKDAWRNPTMHLDTVYDQDAAEGIFRAVRLLLMKIAERIQPTTD